MNFYDKLLDMIEHELEQFATKGDITESGAKMIDTLAHSVKSIETIMAMREASGDYSGEGRYSGTTYYDTGMRGTSRARNRRRDSMGRYSRTGTDDDMIMELEEIKLKAPESMKYKFQNMIDELRR